MPKKTATTQACKESPTSQPNANCLPESDATRRKILITSNLISAVVALAFLSVMAWYFIRKYRKRRSERNAVKDLETELLPPYTPNAPLYASQTSISDELGNPVNERVLAITEVPAIVITQH
jgi:hypothetical protein